MSTSLVPVQTFVEPELRKRFKIACASQNTDMTKVLREFIAWWTERKEHDE